MLHTAPSSLANQTVCLLSASSGVAQFICNTDTFGYIIKPEAYADFRVAASRFLDFKLKTLGTAINDYYYKL